MSIFIGGRIFTIFLEKGPKSADRVEVPELGGFLSRRFHREVQQLGVTIEQYRDLPKDALYNRNAEQFAAVRGMSVEAAMRDRQFIQASVQAWQAHKNKDWRAKEDALQAMGYAVDYLDEGGRS